MFYSSVWKNKKQNVSSILWNISEEKSQTPQNHSLEATRHSKFTPTLLYITAFICHWLWSFTTCDLSTLNMTWFQTKILLNYFMQKPFHSISLYIIWNTSHTLSFENILLTFTWNLMYHMDTFFQYSRTFFT